MCFYFTATHLLPKNTYNKIARIKKNQASIVKLDRIHSNQKLTRLDIEMLARSCEPNEKGNKSLIIYGKNITSMVYNLKFFYLPNEEKRLIVHWSTITSILCVLPSDRCISKKFDCLSKHVGMHQADYNGNSCISYCYQDKTLMQNDAKTKFFHVQLQLSLLTVNCFGCSAFWRMSSVCC